MRYDKESGRLLLSCRELVATARRGLSVALPVDSDEPEARGITKRLLRAAVGDGEGQSLTLPFFCREYPAELTAYAEKVSENQLWFAIGVDCNPERPRAEYKAQIRGEGFVTAYAYALEKGLSRVKLNYVYINSETEKYAVRSEETDISRLAEFFDKCVSCLALYAGPEIERVTKRLPSMSALKFPYKEIREGQGDFVRSAYKTIARGGTLYATAPTGTGKTVSAIYPALRAMGDGRCDKVFYLTPKETTAKAAIDTLLLMAEAGADVRAVKLSAKERCCKNGLLCREERELCENAACNRLYEATLALYATDKTVVTASDIDEVARRFTVCPHELSLTYSELCDVVICDFNYLFDPAVYIRRFFGEGGNYAFLIDEAHNLPDRAREMYSAEISDTGLVPEGLLSLLGEFSELRRKAFFASEKLREILFPYVKEDMYVRDDGEKSAATHLSEIPLELYSVFDELIAVAEKEILIARSGKDIDKNRRKKLLGDYYRLIKKFRTVMQNFDDSYKLFIFYENGELRAKLFCIDTGREIAKRLEKGKAAVFFSATLSPIHYYKSLLGGDTSSDVLSLPSPFDSEQLSVSIMDKVSTRISERRDTLSAVCRIIAATVSAKRGNYMIFSPSFEYSKALASAFSAKYPKIKVLLQKEGMSHKERADFLKSFSEPSDSYLIGFCVLGGIYSEGIDLAGNSLIGAVIVGIGMPALSYEREAICAYFDEKYEEGKAFAYVYPGMNRVLQAAGRVIRREDDRGVIVLIDDRFDDPIYKKIIPSLWRSMKFLGDPKDLRAELDEFWSENA